MIDGEAVILGGGGVSDFNALHGGKQNGEVQLCAFDVLAVDGDDLRDLPLSMRKANLERLLRGRPDGIFVNPFEARCDRAGPIPRRLRHGGTGPFWKTTDLRAARFHGRFGDLLAVAGDQGVDRGQDLLGYAQTGQPM